MRCGRWVPSGGRSIGGISCQNSQDTAVSGQCTCRLLYQASQRLAAAKKVLWHHFDIRHGGEQAVVVLADCMQPEERHMGIRMHGRFIKASFDTWCAFQCHVSSLSAIATLRYCCDC
jgi:hypothetical protein